MMWMKIVKSDWNCGKLRMLWVACKIYIAKCVWQKYIFSNRTQNTCSGWQRKMSNWRQKSRGWLCYPRYPNIYPTMVCWLSYKPDLSVWIHSIHGTMIGTWKQWRGVRVALRRPECTILFVWIVPFMRCLFSLLPVFLACSFPSEVSACGRTDLRYLPCLIRNTLRSAEGNQFLGTLAHKS